jgi:hypothetical protein
MNLEERFLNQAAAEKLPEGIVEVGPLTREQEQFSDTATKRGDGVGFATGAAQSAVSSGAKTAPTNLVPSGQVTQPVQKQITPDDVNKMIADPAYRFDTVSNQIRDIFNKEPQSELIPLNRTMREDLSYSMQQILVDKFGVDNYRAAKLSDTLFGGERSGAPLGLGLVDVTPFVIPLSFQESGISAGKSFDQIDRGNLGQAALEYGMGMVQGAEAIPAVGMAVKGLKAGAKSLAPNIADVMESGLRKTGMITDIVPDGKSVMQQAPKSDIGFYSAVENAAVNVQRKSGTGQSFLNDIMKGENVKAEEIKWIGLDDFLKSKKNVTKQEVQDYIANNKVDVQEVKSTVIRPLLDNGARPVMEGDKGAFLPKFGKYVLEGGENYRELLLTMPNKNMAELDAAQKQADSFRKQTADLLADWKRISEEKPASDESKAAYLKVTDSRRLLIEAEKTVSAMKKESGSQTYSSSHFSQPNILAHLRVNDRVDADGKKMLLIEEVQSDWHQAGRDKGYTTTAAKDIEKQFKDYSKELAAKYDLNPEQNLVMYATMKRMQPEEVSKYEQLQSASNSLKVKGSVPDAPFKDTWYQLALKRALQHAAENGYERVGLTTGKQQADRFSLSNEVNTLAWRDAGGGVKRAVSLDMVNGENITLSVDNTGKVMGGNFEGKSLSSVIGKDLSNKIMSEDTGNLAGEGLNIGGDGMKKYYDEIYPKFLEKYGKKWNAKMGETNITTDRPIVNGVPSMYPDKETVRYIDITPEMKAGVKKGQPLFAAAPIGAATGAATMQDEGKK